MQDAAANGLAVIVSRHERKSGGDLCDSGRGGSAFSGAVDIVVAIRRGEGKTKPTVRVLRCLSRFSETPYTLVIDLTDEGYVSLGAEGAVAVLEAEAAMLDRLPQSLERRPRPGVIANHRTHDQQNRGEVRIKNLFAAGKVGRFGAGKKGDPHRYFSAMSDSVATQIPYA